MSNSQTPANQLRKDSLGVAAVTFLVVSAAAPLTAVAGGVPLSMLLGNGPGIPLTFLLVTAILLLFSAGYVAMERVTATLQGRSGSFALQHSGTMDRGTPSLSISVVPDSGTDGLTGISGRMQIDISDGQHFYTFEYVLPATP